MTRPVFDKPSKEYHTGAGGKTDAVRGAVGLAIWIGFIVWTWPSVFAAAKPGTAPDVIAILLVGVLLPIGLLASIGYFLMNERNARVIVSDDGLLIQNWRKSRKLILWESICWLTWYNLTHILPSTYWLKPVVRNPRGRPSRKTIWVAPRSCLEDAKELRDEIIARCALSESDGQLPPVVRTVMSLVGFRDFRFWRRDEVVE